MQILTRNEATHRAATLEVSSIDVTVDVSGAADSSQETYPVTSVLTLTAREERTFIDIAGQVRAVLLNGAEHPFEDDEDRVWVSGLPVGESLTLEVRALAHYSRSGEGLHRYTDPEDGEVYLYTQFEPNDAHRAWPCIDQPDVKPEWTFHVIAPPSWVVFSNGVEVGAAPAGDHAPAVQLHHRGRGGTVGRHRRGNMERRGERRRTRRASPAPGVSAYTRALP